MYKWRGNFPSILFVLGNGKLLITPNHVYAGSSKLDLTKDTNTVYTHPTAIQCNAKTEIDSLKSFVSNGKIRVANAITGKGVSASGNDSFATLASKITQIPSAKQVIFSATADSFGRWYMPAFGFVPRAFYAFQMRAWNEANIVSFQSIDFALGMSWTLENVYLAKESDSGMNSNGNGIGSEFIPAKFANAPNSSTDSSSRLNPNNYINGQLFPFYASYRYHHENSQFIIYVIPA